MERIRDFHDYALYKFTLHYITLHRGRVAKLLVSPLTPVPHYYQTWTS